MTREVLDSRGPAVAVEIETNLGEKPTFLQKSFPRMFAQRPQKVTVYVCCPECVARVKSDPDTYILKAIAVKNGLAR